jgi:hypothetical protein
VSILAFIPSSMLPGVHLYKKSNAFAWVNTRNAINIKIILAFAIRIFSYELILDILYIYFSTANNFW